MTEKLTICLYLLPAILVYAIYLKRHKKKLALNREVFIDSVESGMTSPPSLHPVIDHSKCIGCEACVHACPEFPAHNVLGVIRGKANLISPTDCIGHGACKVACPVNAISLVFGTSERGVDIPNLSAEFQTNVPGIYIAGELGGMGLIGNAVEQGRQAMQYMAQQLTKRNAAFDFDVCVVGAGPAGFAATLQAKELGLSVVTLEQHALGGTVANFPRGKLVMTRPVDLPLYGKMRFTETSKEELINFWNGVEEQTGIDINYAEKLEGITRIEGGFRLTTNTAEYQVSKVLLALGRRGTPRQLGVPGEDSAKVIYTMIDPSEYAGKHVCVVGGGDSALEAAHTIAREPGAQVLLSYRSSSFTRAKRKNRELVAELEAEGVLRVELESTVQEIREDTIVLKKRDGVVEIVKNDTVIVCAGGILPTVFLEEVGIEVETKYGTA